jgi:CDP-diacylglycerol--serine O-phosphatidyltransferase
MLDHVIQRLTDAPTAAPKPPTRRRRRGKRGRGRGRDLGRRGVSVLPTLLTLGNGLCGFAAIVAATRPASVDMLFGWSPLHMAAVLVFLGMLLDGLDGRVARLTRSTSDLGGQLDSMSDMVTFGVAPAVLLVQLAGVRGPFLAVGADLYMHRLAMLIGCIYVACAALRLARFNLETQLKAESSSKPATHFSGLPSPGAAGVVASLVMVHQGWLTGTSAVATAAQPVLVGVMLAVVLGVGLAMVSRLRYVHVMNVYIRDRAKFERLAVAVILGLLLLVFPDLSLCGAFLIYALSPLPGLLRRRGRVGG